MLKIVVKISPTKLPFARKINDVTPVIVVTKYNHSLFFKTIKKTTTVTILPSHNNHSNKEKYLNIFFILHNFTTNTHIFELQKIVRFCRVFKN